MKRINTAFIISCVVALGLLAFAAYEGFAPNPVIDPELGDLKLFAFILTGTIAGFALGYSLNRLRAGRQAATYQEG